MMAHCVAGPASSHLLIFLARIFSLVLIVHGFYLWNHLINLVLLVLSWVFCLVNFMFYFER